MPNASLLASSESLQLEMDFETFFPTAEGSGDIHLEVGGQLVAAPLPSFRSRRRQTLKMSAGRPWLKVGPFVRSILRCDDPCPLGLQVCCEDSNEISPMDGQYVTQIHSVLCP